MSWGVATQNGVSVSLASIVSLSCGATEFSPASLFTSGVQGAWYDPSDYSTLFQDSAGTTPVTAVEQPVGLMLDKSQGLVLGSELVANWATQASWSVGVTGAVFPGTTIEFDASSDRCTRPSPFTSGKTYLVTFSIVVTSTALFTIDDDGIGGGPGVLTQYFQQGTTGSYSFYLRATSSNRFRFIQSSAGTITVTSFSAKEIAGNHASQATTASRPVLRARYNLLTYSEQFDNAVWAKLQSGTGVAPAVTANYALAPDGTMTADRIVFDRGAGTLSSDISYISQSITSVSASCTGSISLRTTDGSSKTIVLRVGGTFDYAVPVTGTWTKFTLTGASPVSRLDLLAYGDRQVQVTDLLVWGADLRTGSSAGTYQRIAAATDYATAGFLPYLALDGTDDSFGTGSIDFSATDKMFVCAGLTKNSDAATAILAELSTDLNSNNGSFYLGAPINVATPSYQFRTKGTLVSSANYSNAAVAAVVTNVVTGIGDIAGDGCSLRVNGTQVASAVSDQGTGNYGNYPLYIGRRANTNFPLNGRIYQFIVCGKTLTAAELASTEAFVATKTGVTL